MSINEISFNNLRIIHVCKANLKNSYISVKKNGEITLKTPKVSNDFIQKLLRDRELWIRKQLKIVENNPPKSVNIQDEVLLFGEIFSIDSTEAIELREALEKIDISNISNVLKSYDKFYKKYAQSYIVPRVEHYSNIMNLSYSEIKFRKMRSRWGSCSSRGVITLNIELIKIDRKLIDFIVVHELAHLKHMNHSKKFHSLVNEYIPDSSVLNQELKRFSLL
ncbi:MAG: SprT family zinc-dependent metalloprotease [Sulfurimonas sp.]|uniref:M48 family metallopeptidase n=1 Tax=Sulfurimonas sp. TaxID=2022749 RepID=UPI001BBE5B53|nr:SprT family zinc-dependent metalloprotease [Sulfurimonas sp.]MBS4068950.1 M48 family metallopeptidase [Sulfurimonas sp.]MDD3855290.1 SprT family zinc-dependent metalloprotease [Sulfurimonas sp.]MDX9756244.1 SprT family zinc-dependent metalloprotease [Sulfurimonas sp.]